MSISLDDVRAMDRQDPLAGFKAQFALPTNTLYLDGNSLGAQPLKARQYVADTMDQWRDELIKGWNQGWFDAPERLGKKLAPLIGAQGHEVLVTDTITLNLYKLLGYASQAQSGVRRVILSEGSNFPADGYIAEGFCHFAGFEHRVLPPETELADYLNDEVAVVVLSQVNYRSGWLRDMASTTALIHQYGAEVIWDLAHSAGALPVALNQCGVRFAVGCTYKYLNGGPGAPAFVYVAEDAQNQGWQPLTGWHGHAAPFAFEGDYAPATGLTAFRTGTHSALVYAALEASLDIWQDVDMQALRDKSLAMTELFRHLLEEVLRTYGIDDVTPLKAERGSQVALMYPENGYAVVQALIARGVIGDYREPGLMRFGFTPLYLGYEDVWQAARHFREVLSTGEYRQERFQARSAVT